MFKKVTFYSLLFFASLLVFLVATLPASILWQKVLAPEIPVQRLGVKVLGVDGSIWGGRVHLDYKGLEGILDWDLELSGLLSFELPVSFTLDSHLGLVEGQVAAGAGTIALRVFKAELDLAPVNALLKRERVTLDGQVLINNLSVRAEGRQVRFAEGKGSWSGGDIAYPVIRDIHERTLPPFFARIETLEDGMVRLGVKDADVDFDFIEATLNSEGEALLQVKRRLLDLADEPARHPNETDVVFKVKKPLY